ncbi:MAG: hypothetical protein ACFFG0_37680, partial [Candidatus Thorarchaeota archaeon]
ENAENLLKELDKIDPIQANLFRNLRAFRLLYNQHFKTNMNKILKEREKFVNFLSQKLEYLKNADKIDQEDRKDWKEAILQHLHKNTSLTLKEKSQIFKIIQNQEIGEEDRKNVASILSKLPTEDLISLLGRDFKRLTQRYVKWGWDYDQGLRRTMLIKYFQIEKIDKETNLKPKSLTESNSISHTAEESSDIRFKLKALETPIRTFREYLIYRLKLKIFLLTRISKKISDAALSRLLFGDSNYLNNVFFSGKKSGGVDITRRPDPYVLFRIKLMVLQWKKESFEAEGFEIDPHSLKTLKEEISDVIDSFMFKNPYSAPYVNERPRRGRGRRIRYYNQDYLIPEFKVVQWLWLAYAIHEDNPKLTFNDIIRKSHLKRGLSKYLSAGNRNFDAKTIKAFLKTIIQFTSEVKTRTTSTNKIKLTVEEKIKIYSIAFSKLLEYKHVRKLRFIRREVPWYNRDIWYTKVCKAYHTIFLFARQLGFDILTFTPLNDEIFLLKITGTRDEVDWLSSEYRRHHFRDAKNRKESILLQDLILTILRLHPYYDKLSESEVLVLLDTFESMIMNDGTGRKGDWTRTDVKNLLKGNEWVLYNEKTGWFKNPDFEHYLDEFNVRRNILKSVNGLEKLIIRGRYKCLSERFYKLVEEDGFRSMMLFISNPSLRQYSDLLAIDFFFSKNPDLKDYFNYKPYLFKYWFGD